MYIPLKKNFLSISIFFILILLLSGCGSEDESISDYAAKNPNPTEEKEINEIQENKERDTPLVSVISAKKNSQSPLLSLSGTVVAKDEVTVSAEASGVVSQIWKKEGDSVIEGERILMLNTGNNLALASYNSAMLAKKNAAIALQLQQESSTTDIENARIANKQAQVSLEQNRRTAGSEKRSISAQSTNAKEQVKLAQTNLEISQTSLEQTITNESKTQKNILENTGNTLSQTLVNFRSSMNMADELIGSSEVNKIKNDEFAVYLEGKTVGIMLPTQDLWNQTDPQITAAEESFRNFEKETYTAENEEEMMRLSAQTIENAKHLRMILRNIESMLKESIPAPVFPQSKIDSLKAQIVQHQNIIEQNIAQVSAVNQALSDFHIQSPQRITNAKMRVSVAESQLNAAKQTLNSIQNSGESKSIGVDTAFQQAKENFRASQNQVKSAEIKTKLSVQSAQAQLDSANAQLAQAEISLSKLTIRSGINGTITKLLKREGDTVSMGTPVVIIADYSSLKLKGDVSIAESISLKKGMTAKVKVDDINETLEGKLSLIFPEADKVTKRVPIEITIQNTKNIPANIFATAKIFLEQESDTLFIPESTLLPPEEDQEHPENTLQFVFIAENTPGGEKSSCQDPDAKECYILRKKQITLGKKVNNQIEILSGISSQDNIITSYNDTLKEGDEVRIKE